MNRQDGIIVLLLLFYRLVRTMPLLSVDAVGEILRSDYRGFGEDRWTVRPTNKADTVVHCGCR
jgi:hypothetical protein